MSIAHNLTLALSVLGHQADAHLDAPADRLVVELLTAVPDRAGDHLAAAGHGLYQLGPALGHEPVPAHETATSHIQRQVFDGIHIGDSGVMDWLGTHSP